jgi:ssDNA-binding replication factor A large subunit
LTCSQNKHNTARNLVQKRKRLQEAEDLAPAEKRARASSCVIQNKEAARDTNKSGHPVEYWIQEGS